MTFRKTLALLASLACCGSALAKAPAAPSDFKVKPLGSNSFLLQWKDNSNNELGWEISISLGAVQKAERFTLLGQANLTSYAIITNDLPGATLTFQLAAYNGTAGLEKFSPRTAPVVVKALDAVTFNSPTQLLAKPLDDGRIQLSWNEDSTTESGYQIQFRKGQGKWQDFSYTQPGLKFNFPALGFKPDTEYSFRVRGYKGSPARFTTYSNVSTARTKPFLKPINLEATAEGEGAVSLKWKDRSSIEAGCEIETRIGTAAFSKLADVPAGTNAVTPIKGFALGADVDFRVRAFRMVNSTKVYTGYSNIAVATTPKIYKPTNLTASTQGNSSSVKLTWKDNSSREAYFLIQYRKVGSTDFATAGSVVANATEYVVTNLAPHTHYEFRVGSSEWFGVPSYSSLASATTKYGIVGNLNPVIIANDGFFYRVLLSDITGLTSVEVTGLPAGLTFDSTDRTISGSVAADGTYTVTIKAHYSDGTVSTRSLVLKTTTEAPQSVGSFAKVNVAVAATKNVSLAGKFTDQDTLDAVRLHTTKGDIDILLYPDATPVTVDNFLNYVEDGLYADSFFHRAPQDFVVQGGGFRHSAAAGYNKVPTFPAIVNEPGLSNVRGTVAMAKLGGDPNSATSQFFFNLGDNTANLDSQNGGFTVFGRLSPSSLDVIDSINSLPEDDYTISVDGTPVDFEDVPVDVESAPASLDPAQLVKITSVDYPPLLTYEVTSGDTAIATAALNSAGTEVVITAVATGSTSITVKATDLDGKSVTQSIPVTVP